MRFVDITKPLLGALRAGNSRAPATSQSLTAYPSDKARKRPARLNLKRLHSPAAPPKSRSLALLVTSHTFKRLFSRAATSKWPSAANVISMVWISSSGSFTVRVSRPLTRSKNLISFSEAVAAVASCVPSRLIAAPPEPLRLANASELSLPIVRTAWPVARSQTRMASLTVTI